MVKRANANNGYVSVLQSPAASYQTLVNPNPNPYLLLPNPYLLLPNPYLLLPNPYLLPLTPTS